MKYSSLAIVVFSIALGIAVGLMLDPLTKAEDHGQVAIWLEVVHRVCTGIGGLGTFVALIILLGQFNLVQTQTEFIRKNILASIEAQLYGRLDSFNQFVFEHSTEYDLLDKSLVQVDLPGQRSKLHRMCELGFTLFEEIYKQRVRLNLVDTEDWNEWEQNVIHFFSKAYVQGYWKTVEGRYATTFRDFVNALVQTMQSR